MSAGKSEDRDAQDGSAASAEITRLLRARFTEVQLKRPEYSMRAFSKTLGLTATQFSEIINGKRTLSRKLATRILDRLDVDPELATRLIEGLPAKQVRSKRAKREAERALKIPSAPQKNAQKNAKKPILNSIPFG